jgi:hypothetical protein
MNSADCLLGKMQRKWFMGPHGALVVYLLRLKAVPERSLFWRFVGELSANRKQSRWPAFVDMEQVLRLLLVFPS